MDSKAAIWHVISWVFGLLFLTVGLINVFWGNDPGFGAAIILLALLYFPPVSALIEQRTGFSVSPVVKTLLGIGSIWAALGVGELADKIHLMLQSVL